MKKFLNISLYILAILTWATALYLDQLERFENIYDPVIYKRINLIKYWFAFGLTPLWFGLLICRSYYFSELRIIKAKEPTPEPEKLTLYDKLNTGDHAAQLNLFSLRMHINKLSERKLIDEETALDLLNSISAIQAQMRRSEK